MKALPIQLAFGAPRYHLDLDRGSRPRGPAAEERCGTSPKVRECSHIYHNYSRFFLNRIWLLNQSISDRYGPAAPPRVTESLSFKASLVIIANRLNISP